MNEHEQDSVNPPWMTDPLQLLRDFEDPNVHDAQLNLSFPEPRVRYETLIRLLRKKSLQHWELLDMAENGGSEGAARAIQSTLHFSLPEAIRNAINKYMNEHTVPVSSDEPRVAAYCTEVRFIGVRKLLHPVIPLALGKSTDPEDIDLLGRAARWKRDTDYFAREDDDFRGYAAEALLRTPSKEAVHEVLCLLVESEDASGKSPIQLRLPWAKCPSKAVAEECRRLLSLGKSQTVYCIARDYEKMNPISAAFAALFHRKRYSCVLTALDMTANDIFA